MIVVSEGEVTEREGSSERGISTHLAFKFQPIF